MIGTSKGLKVAIGFRAHSGWACAVLVAGTRSDIRIVDRRRIELCDMAVEGAKQPFHHAEAMKFADAERFIARCKGATDVFAREAIRGLIAQTKGFRFTGACVITASGRPLPDLRGILASHALIHAAEGEFYRAALSHAAEELKLPATQLREKDATVRACARFGLTESVLAAKLVALGKGSGPPWGADQKLATLAAWLTLAQ